MMMWWKRKYLKQSSCTKHLQKTDGRSTDCGSYEIFFCLQAFENILWFGERGKRWPTTNVAMPALVFLNPPLQWQGLKKLISRYIGRAPDTQIMIVHLSNAVIHRSIYRYLRHIGILQPSEHTRLRACYYRCTAPNPLKAPFMSETWQTVSPCDFAQRNLSSMTKELNSKVVLPIAK